MTATDPGRDGADLSSVASQLAELTRRVTAHADAYRAAGDTGIAEDLYAAERSLLGAQRTLARARDVLSDRI